MAFSTYYAYSPVYIAAGITKALIQQYDPYIRCGLIKPYENCIMVDRYHENQMRVERGSTGGTYVRPVVNSREKASYGKKARTTIGRGMVKISATPSESDTTDVGEVVDGLVLEKYLATMATAPSGMDYLQSRVEVQATSVMHKYMQLVISQIFDDNYLKTDGDTQGSDGVAVTFVTDTTAGAGAPVTSTVDMTSTTVSKADQWYAIQREEEAACAKINLCYPRGPIYRLLPANIFNVFYERCESAKATGGTRYGEVDIDGTKIIEGADCFTYGRKVYLRCADGALPKTTGEGAHTKTLIMAKEAIRVFVNMNPMTSAVNLDLSTNDTISQVRSNNVSFTQLIKSSFGQSPNLMVELESLLSSPVQQRMLMAGDGNVGLMSALSSSFERLPPSTSALTSKNYLLETEMDFCTVRANNYMLREIDIPDALMPASVETSKLTISSFGANVKPLTYSDEPTNVPQESSKKGKQHAQAQTNLQAPTPMEGAPKSDVE